jgi:hypothetical protein
MQEGGLVRWWPLLLVAAGLLVWAAGRRAPSASGKLEINSAPRAKSAAPSKIGSSKSGSQPAPRAALGEYSQPAPGASIDILPDND